MKTPVALLLLLVFASPMRGHTQATSDTYPVAERNYRLGEEREVFVGEAIVRAKEQAATRIDQRIVRPRQSFSFRKLFKQEVTAGAELPIVGSREINGRNYSVIRLPSFSLSLVDFFVDDEGTLLPRFRTHIDQWVDFKPKPADVSFEFGTSTTVQTANLAGQRNFELIYGGVAGDQVRVAYREFTGEDLIRPAFSQDLIYSLKAGKIRYRSIDIEVVDATNESIRYRVLADGLAGHQDANAH